MSNFLRKIKRNQMKGANMNNRIPMGVPRVGGIPGQVMIGPGDTIQSRCNGCNGELFDLVYRHVVLPKVSPKNPTGQDYPIKVETFICHNCGLEMGKKADCSMGYYPSGLRESSRRY